VLCKAASLGHFHPGTLKNIKYAMVHWVTYAPLTKIGMGGEDFKDIILQYNQEAQNKREERREETIKLEC
jgi:hypothetical protein